MYDCQLLEKWPHLQYLDLSLENVHVHVGTWKVYALYYNVPLLSLSPFLLCPLCIPLPQDEAYARQLQFELDGGGEVTVPLSGNPVTEIVSDYRVFLLPSTLVQGK